MASGNLDISANNFSNQTVAMASGSVLAPTPSVAQHAVVQSIATLDAALQAAQPSTYTDAALKVMSKNDKIFAYKQLQGIK